jgi:hypothetical protein
VDQYRCSTVIAASAIDEDKRPDVGLWHIASVSAVQRHVRSWMNSGSRAHALKTTFVTRADIAVSQIGDPQIQGRSIQFDA